MTLPRLVGLWRTIGWAELGRTRSLAARAAAKARIPGAKDRCNLAVRHVFRAGRRRALAKRRLL